MIDLRLGDCLEVMRGMEDKSVDLILTDPPYGIGISSNPFRQKFEKKDWDDFTPSKEYFDEIFRISKEQVIWGGNYFNLPPHQCFFVWDKNQPQDFSSAMCEMAWVSKKMPAKIGKVRVVGFTKYHPTTKPLNLMRWCLDFFPDSKTVFDPFMGSGTTGVACRQLHKDFIGCEIDPTYYEIAKNRIQTTQEMML